MVPFQNSQNLNLAVKLQSLKFWWSNMTTNSFLSFSWWKWVVFSFFSVSFFPARAQTANINHLHIYSLYRRPAVYMTNVYGQNFGAHLSSRAFGGPRFQAASRKHWVTINSTTAVGASKEISLHVWTQAQQFHTTCKMKTRCGALATKSWLSSVRQVLPSKWIEQWFEKHVRDKEDGIYKVEEGRLTSEYHTWAAAGRRLSTFKRVESSTRDTDCSNKCSWPRVFCEVIPR